MDRIIKEGEGWRLGWNPQASEFQGLIGGEAWSLELTAAELDDFCRLLGQLADTMVSMASELMPEEKITCEAESALLWIEAAGYSHAYSLHFILQTGRQAEGSWPAAAVPGLVQATQMLKVF